MENFEKLLNEENEWNDELSAEYVEGPADMIKYTGKNNLIKINGLLLLLLSSSFNFKIHRCYC